MPIYKRLDIRAIHGNYDTVDMGRKECAGRVESS